MHIYLFTNLVNGKRYVGQTINDPKIRHTQHWTNSKQKTQRDRMPITFALHKYGRSAFKFEVIEECMSQNELNERERYWISHHNSLAPNGYNLTVGGQSGKEYCQATRMKMSATKKGCRISEEHRLNIAKRMQEKKEAGELSHLRKPKLSLREIETMRQRYVKGESVANLALEFGTSPGTLYKYIRQSSLTSLD